MTGKSHQSSKKCTKWNSRLLHSANNINGPKSSLFFQQSIFPIFSWYFGVKYDLHIILKGFMRFTRVSYFRWLYAKAPHELEMSKKQVSGVCVSCHLLFVLNDWPLQFYCIFISDTIYSTVNFNKVCVCAFVCEVFRSVYVASPFSKWPSKSVMLSWIRRDLSLSPSLTHTLSVFCFEYGIRNLEMSSLAAVFLRTTWAPFVCVCVCVCVQLSELM